MKRLCLVAFIIAFVFSCQNDDDTVIVQCKIPSSLSVTNITDISAILNWTNTNTNQNVTLEYGSAGFTIGTGTIVSTSLNSLTINGLNPDSSYEFYVQAICSVDNVSMQSSAGAFNTDESPVIPQFLPNLSQLNLFSGHLYDLTISSHAFKYELVTALFSDYSHKLRIAALPSGESMDYNGDGFPVFPNGTVLAKTFYYNFDETNLSLGKQIIETRVLIRENDDWTIGNYKWNDDQTDATLDEDEHIVPVAWVNSQGENMNTNYVIPSQDNCIKCHGNNGNIEAIGPKLRNMNFVVDGVNQLQKFMDSGHLTNAPDPGSIGALPDWNDTNLTLESRSRAYFDINCAHCHAPGGFCEFQSTLDFRFETALEDTDIFERRNSIINRMQNYTPGFSMPFIGTTMVHTEGFALIQEYVDSLD